MCGAEIKGPDAEKVETIEAATKGLQCSKASGEGMNLERGLIKRSFLAKLVGN